MAEKPGLDPATPSLCLPSLCPSKRLSHSCFHFLFPPSSKPPHVSSLPFSLPPPPSCGCVHSLRRFTSPQSCHSISQPSLGAVWSSSKTGSPSASSGPGGKSPEELLEGFWWGVVFGTASEAQVQPLIQETAALGPAGADTCPNSAGGGVGGLGWVHGAEPPAPSFIGSCQQPSGSWLARTEDGIGAGGVRCDANPIPPRPSPTGLPEAAPRPRNPGAGLQPRGPLVRGAHPTDGWVGFLQTPATLLRPCLLLSGALGSAVPFLWASVSASKGHSRPPQRVIWGHFSRQTENPSRLRVREKSLL